jgi:hypothetical protein
VAYHSRKFKPTDINYDVHDKEMLAIVTAFKEWEHMLKLVAGVITVSTDHQNCSILLPQKSRPDGKRVGQSTYHKKSRPDGKRVGQSTYHKKSRPDGKRVGQSTLPSSILTLFTDPARKDVLSRRWDNALKEGSEASPVSFF